MRGLLAQARKRVIGHLVLDKSALALAIGMGGVVLLLLAGTQILDWYWPVLLTAVSLGVGVYQLRKHIPSSYEIAQRIDKRLQLADALSTATYFSEHPTPGLEAVCKLQFKEADQLASSVNLEQALPLKRSPFLIPAAILLAAATSLFVVRYVMTGSMDLRTSLFEMVADTFFSTPEERLEAQAKREELRAKMSDPSQASPDAQQEQQLPPDAEKGAELKQDQKSGDASGDEGQDADNQQGDKEDQSSKDGAPKDQKGAKENEREGEDKGDSAPQAQDQRSMLDKLRDAVNNLMNKVNQQEGQQSSQKNKDKQKGQKQQDKGKQDKGEKGDDSESAEGDPQSSQDGDQKNQENAKKSEAPGQKPSQDAQSGAGENDGKKDIENAKALEAMGKVSELLGQRSQQLTGEVMVEVGQTQQQLKTAMTQQKAGHTDAGGEIHRDQVPLAYQTFVERYFQEVRKGTEPAPAKGAASGKAAPQAGKAK